MRPSLRAKAAVQDPAMGIRVLFMGLALWLTDFAAIGVAEAARDADECQRTWARAVRSYVARTKGKAGPDGATPQTLDDEERVAQAWNAVFSEACALEAEGDKDASRLAAALSGARALIRVDPPACTKFMRYYMGSSRADDICTMMKSGTGTEGVRKTLASSIPSR